MRGLPDFLEAVVKRHRSQANDIRLAPIADDAAAGQRIEYLPAARSARAQARTRELAAALLRVRQA